MQQFTNKALKDAKTLYAPYCALQAIEGFLPRIGYTAGIYGWNADVYSVGDVLIVTGYRPAGRYEITSDDYSELIAAKDAVDVSSDTPHYDAYRNICNAAHNIYTRHLANESAARREKFNVLFARNK